MNWSLHLFSVSLAAHPDLDYDQRGTEFQFSFFPLPKGQGPQILVLWFGNLGDKPTAFPGSVF
jgi:hypothetical protein